MIDLIFYLSFLIFSVLLSGVFFSKFIFYNKIHSLHLYEIGFLGIFFHTFLATFVHYFLPLNTNINFLIWVIFFCNFLFFFESKSLLRKLNDKKLIILISFFISLVMTIKFRTHEDYGFYHLPYIINVISEKIIFGLANLQVQYAWNSTWLNFSSSLNFPIMELKGVLLSNSILYFFLLIFIFDKILNFKKENYSKLSFYFIVFFIFYCLIKFSRLSEHGFDFPANLFLILSFYYFIKLFENRNINSYQKNFIFIFFLSILGISIKLSTFISPILILSSFIFLYREKFKFLKIMNVLILGLCCCFIWLIQQFIYTSCLIPFFEFSCIASIEWYNPGLANALNDVTGAVNKSFNDYSGYLDKNEYIKNFNWVVTWFDRNKIEFAEHFAAIFIPIFIIISINLYKLNFKNEKVINSIKYPKIFYYTIIIFLFFGLSVWFLKSPVIRFGVPYFYIAIFFISVYFLFYKFKRNLHIGFLSILIICVAYNLSKNFNRINKVKDSEKYFPQILNINYSSLTINNYEINYPDHHEVSTQSNLCWSIPFICHIGKGKNIHLKKRMNYYFITYSNNE